MAWKMTFARVQQSQVFARLKAKAREYALDPAKLSALAEGATRKAGLGPSGPLAEVWESTVTCFRLLKAYAKREYTAVAWPSLLLIVAAVLYFVMPGDLIPDLLAGLGLMDDAALLAWVAKTVKKEIEKFREWEVSVGA